MNGYINEPLEINMPAPNGTYEITVTITAHSDTTFSLYSQHRSFIVRDREIKKGESVDITFAVSVSDRHFAECEYEKAAGIKIQIATDGDITATAAVSPVDIPTVYICGDSTVTDQPASYPYEPSSTYCGWGQAFPELIYPSLAVSNHAQSGSCTTEFIANNLTAFENKINRGDYMVIEFGHNDQKRTELDAMGGYKKNLLYLAETARKAGAEPIICSPINRILFMPNGKLMNLLGSYRDAAKAAAKEAGCTFIDMWQRTTDYFETAGPVKSKQFFRHDDVSHDYTHTNDIGGRLIAKMFAQEMIAKKGPLAKHIAADRTETVQLYASPEDKADNAADFAHVAGVGLVNVPEDFDADIRDLQK